MRKSYSPSVILTLILAFALLCSSLAGCGLQTSEAVATDETTITPAAGSAYNIDVTSEYVIVRPDEGGEYTIKYTSLLHTAIMEKSGVDCALTTDWVKKGETIPSDRKEILVGHTNRPESEDAFAKLGYSDYYIGVSGQKIVICGGGDLSTMKAIKKFEEDFVSGGALAIPSDYSYTFTADTDACEYIAVTDQKNACVSVYDLSVADINSDEALVFRYRLDSSHATIADVKLRKSDKYGTVIIITCSNYAAIVSYPEGKLLFGTDKLATNGHASELLPDGSLAVASSTGGAVRVFDTDSGKYSSVSLTDAHGVLWDPDRELLFAIGSNVLTAYRYKAADSISSAPALEEAAEYRVTIPTDSAHDLYSFYGDNNKVWVTTYYAVYQYNKETKTFAAEYDGSALINVKNVKSIGNFPNSATYVRTIPNAVYQTWNTDTVDIIRQNADGKYTLESRKIDGTGFYKVRVFCPDYN